jgi:hypothetical protein
MVVAMWLLTVSTDSVVSLLDGWLFSNICNPTVSKHPLLSLSLPLLLLPSLEVPMMLLLLE